MHINEFFLNYVNHPVLFVGSGFSLRYIQGFKDWNGLLLDVSEDLYGNNEKYFDIKSKYFENGEYQYAKIASVIEADFNEFLEQNRKGKFEKINDEFYSKMKKGENVSRFKIYLAEKFKNYILKEEKLEELKELKKVRKNISAVITTNYDTLIEETFEFNPLIGNDILLSNPYGSVYKIHGCITAPSKIVINDKDYVDFQSKYELIRAQLMSLFIHNPIVFFGYSISDANIKQLLKTIFMYVEPNSYLSKKIRNNFLLVEYEYGSENLDIVEHDIEVEGVATVRINKLKTDDFISIYKKIANLMLPVSAMDIRKVQTVVRQIQKGEDGIKVSITEDLEDLQNSDKILVIGSSNTIQYVHQNQSELLSNYFKIIDEENAALLQLVDKFKIHSTQYYPIFGFSKIQPDIKNLERLQNQQVEKLRTYIRGRANIDRSYTSIQEIMDDENVANSYKNDYILYSSLSKSIDINDLKSYLQNFQNKNESVYKRLLCAFDVLNFSEIDVLQS
ncbi:SIR2 family protein [Myroides odoratimimus]|uniref:SIR2 family protein n=1 Tax=Myroides odoratimimus TaxID=76832 RepID=UPI0025767F22|nr:SIR2 family protein [Myroides odoratimimus]MDM1467350.1 SIR2 family protein [Myroides odoratimimus]